MRLGNGSFGNEPFVVHEYQRFESRAIGHVLPDRPFWQVGDFRRGIGGRITIGHQAHAGVHAAGPDEVGARLSRGLFADDAVVEFGGAEIGIFDRDLRIEHLEIVQERLSACCIGW